MTPDLVVVSEGTINEEMLLGRICFFSLPDDNVPADELLRLWQENDLAEELLPEVRQPVHVFQSACASVKSRAGNGNGREEIRSDEVENNSKRCSYQITRVVWDLDNRVIEHEKALRLEFDKTTQKVRSERLDHFDPALNELEDRVREHYDANMTKVPGAKVRNAVRNTLIASGAQNLRRKSGGLYFVPREIPGTGSKATEGTPTLPILNGLAAVAEGLYDDRGDVHTLPCVNGEGERKMLRKHVAINAAEAAQKLAQKAFGRVRQAATDRAPRQDFVDNLWNERRVLLQSLDHFSELVNLEQADVHQSLRELDTALEELQQLADAA